MAEEFVIDCSGRKVPVGDRLYAAKCWKGNTNDFLEGNKDFVIESASEWWPVPVSIVIPIYRSGEGFAATLLSLYKQNWSVPAQVEFILYINQPPGETQESTKKSVALAKALVLGEELPDRYAELARLVRAEGTPELKLLNEVFEGGLATLYCRSFATLVARLFNAVLARELPTKDEEAEALEVLYKSTFFTIVDDDLVFPDTESFPRAIDSLSAGQSVLLGKTSISSVKSAYPELDEVLLNLMNLFLQFKYAKGAVILPPRSAAVADLFHVKPPLPEVPYADQIWFSAGARDKERVFVPVLTTLEDEEYPSNAQMSAALARFLKNGNNPEAVKIFDNVKQSYESACVSGDDVYTLTDIEALIECIQSRNADSILSFTSKLLLRGDADAI